MDMADSDSKETSPLAAREKVPLSGERLTAAVKALEKPGFLNQLTVRIMKLAWQKGFQSPFENQMDLPGGKSAGDLAVDIVEKALDGTYAWDIEKFPNFHHFCLSRAESILSNWLLKNRRMTTMSPVLEEDHETGDTLKNAVNSATQPKDLYALLQDRDDKASGDKFLQDLALHLPDGSHEQNIVIAVFDNRECANRAFCMKQLKLCESDYDAAVKRLIRRLPAFRDEWLTKNHIDLADWKEAQ
jgi:hypothetical protein